MTEVQRITKGVFLRSLSTISVIFFGMVMSVILNRHFGKESYGLLVLVYSVTGFCMSLSGLGIKSTLGRYIPGYIKSNERDKALHLFTVGTIFQLSGTLFFAVILFFLAESIAISIFHRQELTILLKAGILFFIGFTIVDFTFNVFRSLQAWKKDAIVSVLYPLLYLIIVCIFIFLLKGKLQTILYANAMAALIIIILGFFLLPKDIRSRLFRNLNLNIFFANARRIISFGLPLMFANFSFYLSMWFDKMVLGVYRSNSEITFYYVAVIFANGFMILFKVLYTVFMPYLAGISTSKREVIREKFELFFRWFLQATIIFSLFMFFLIKPVIIFLYGADYFPSVVAFRLLLIVFILRATNNPSGMFLVNVFGKSKKSSILSFTLIASTVLFDLILVPKYGYIGAILASIIGYLVYWTCMLIFAREIRKMIPIQTVLKTALALGPIILGYFLLNQLSFYNVYLLSIVLLTFYILLLKLVNEIRPNDIRLAKEIIGTLRWRKTT